jgi:hypothetical protein
MDDQPTAPDSRWPTIAVILIVVGLIFFFGEVFNIRFGSGFWPLLILVPGLIFLVSAFGGEEANSGLAGVGAVLTTLGLIFFYQNASGNWESWAYIWALLPTSVGLSQMVAGARNGDSVLAESGRRMARTFAIVFAVGLIFFELIIFDRGGVGGYLLPIALIVVGGLMLWTHYRRGGAIPFTEVFQRPGRPEPTSPAPSQPETTASPPPPAPSEPTAATPPPSSPAAASPPPPPPEDHFPEDELPEPPPPDDAPFPTDEESPEPPPAEPPKPKPRRRSTTTRKSTSSRSRRSPPESS